MIRTRLGSEKETVLNEVPSSVKIVAAEPLPPGIAKIYIDAAILFV